MEKYSGGKISYRLSYLHFTATTYYPMVKGPMITPFLYVAIIYYSCVHVYVCMCNFVCVDVCMCGCVYVFVYVCVRVYVCVYV